MPKKFLNEDNKDEDHSQQFSLNFVVTHFNKCQNL